MSNLLISIFLLLISFVTITGYIINISSKHKALKSISDSDYWLVKPWKWVFEATMFVCGGSIVYMGIFALEKPIWSIIIGGIGICIVGVFSRFKLSETYKTLHEIGAFIGFGSLALSFAIELHLWWYSLIIVAAVFLIFKYSKNKGIRIWNTEIILIYGIFIGLITYLILQL